VCYHGTGRIILVSTVTSRAQACQITVTGGLPLHLAICTSTNKHHLKNSQNSSRKRAGFGEVSGQVMDVSKKSAGNYMQERYNQTT
jgi:hypothetical protein